MAADLGNTALRVFHVSGGRGDNKIRNILVPPLKKFRRCFLRFWRCVGLEKVDDKFIELLITEAIIMVHPVGGVCKVEVQLGNVSWVEKQRDDERHIHVPLRMRLHEG